MRFRGRAFITAAMLTAALAFNQSPMHDAYAKSDKELAGKFKKMIAQAKYIAPQDYKLSFLKPLMKIGVEEISHILDYGENGKNPFRLKTKPIMVRNGNKVWLRMRIPKNKQKPGAILVNRKVKKGKYVATLYFTQLRKRLKEETGKDLKYVAVGIDKQKNENGNITKLDFYIIPVNSLEDAKNGNIKAGVPMLVINCDGKGKCNGRTGCNIHNVVDG